MTAPYKKWRDQHRLLLDDCFDCPEAMERLTASGFHVERFTDHFQDDAHRRERNIKDPQVLEFANRGGYVLVTTDGEIYARHRVEFEQCRNLGILATSHNGVTSISIWVDAVIKLKSHIERNSFRKKPRPWFIKFNRTGQITVMHTRPTKE